MMESVKKGSDAMGKWQVYRKKDCRYVVYRVREVKDREVTTQLAFDNITPVFESADDAIELAAMLNNAEVSDEMFNVNRIEKTLGEEQEDK